MASDNLLQLDKRHLANLRERLRLLARVLRKQKALERKRARERLMVSTEVLSGDDGDAA